MSAAQELPWVRAVGPCCPGIPCPQQQQGGHKAPPGTEREAGGCRTLLYLLDKVDVGPRRVVELVALQEKGEAVGAGCAGVTELGPARHGEQLLQLQSGENRGRLHTEQCWVCPRWEQPLTAPGSKDWQSKEAPGAAGCSPIPLQVQRPLCSSWLSPAVHSRGWVVDEPSVPR